MKNKTLLKTLSAFLAIIVFLFSAPLSGFVGLKIPEIKLSEWNPLDFSIKSSAATYSGSCGTNVKWSLDTETCVLNITGTGAMKNYTYSSFAPWFSYSRNGFVKTVKIAEGVTSIGSYSFESNSNLTSITIPGSITSIGEWAFDGCRNLTDVYYTGSFESWCKISFDSTNAHPMSYANNFYINNTPVTKIVIPNTITEIKDYAFHGFKNATSVIISDSITSIGEFAFYNCTSLASITIPDSVTNIGASAFYNTAYYNDSTNWENKVLYISNHLIAEQGFSGAYSIRKGTKTIANGAFSGYNLTSVSIPSSVTSIGKTFGSCKKLTSITVDSGNANYSNDKNGVLFNKNKTTLIKYPAGKTGSYTIPSTVTELAVGAFAGCNLTSVTIPNSITAISDSAFSGCTLSSITIPNSVTVIGNSAFSGCTLSSITIPNSVTVIGNSAFSGITIPTIILPDSITTIGDSAFASSEISSITIPRNVTNMGKSVFDFCYDLVSVTFDNCATNIGDYTFRFCEELTTVKLGNSITSIGDFAFAYCRKLSSISLPDTVTTIGTDAFNSCESFTSINIPDSVISISDNAFAYCYNLAFATIGSNVTSIGRYAFYSCKKLTDIYYNGTEKSWNKITIGPNNDNLGSIAIHFLGCDHENTSSVTKEATCLEAGKITYTCKLCNKSFTETIPALGHTFGNAVIENKINATCTANGSYDTVIYCTVCKAEKSRITTVVNATGHSYNNGIITKQPTCSAEGIKTFTCSSCGDTYTEKIAKKEHVIKTIGSDATCTTDGFSYSVCANCGITLGAPVLVPATGHKTGEWVVTKAPQCAVDGKEELRCTECNELLDSRVITSPGHVYNNDVITKASTCTEDGIKTFTCNCGDSYTEIIPAKGHIAGEWETILEPTTKTDGKKIKKCTICSSTIEEEIIEKLLVVTDTETGIAFEYSGENYTGEVGIIVKETFDGSAFNIINTNLNPSQNKIFDIKMTVDGVVTQPNGEIVVRIPIPKGYDPANTFLYHVDTKTGVVEHVPANVINNHLVFNTTHFSYYAIIELINITLSEINFEQDNYIVNYKGSLKVVATPNVETGKKINYVIGDSTVATIDDEGNITTVGPGTATVVATIEGTDISDTCTITVSYTWWQWIIMILLFGWIWY